MILNEIISAVRCQNPTSKKASGREVARHKYIMEKYNERSITNRYFK